MFTDSLVVRLDSLYLYPYIWPRMSNCCDPDSIVNSAHILIYISRGIIKFTAWQARVESRSGFAGVCDESLPDKE
jgi:hypothetical protein